MPFGEFNDKRLESTRRILSGLVDTSLKTRAMQLELEREKARQAARRSVLDSYMGALAKSQTPYDPDLLKAASQSMIGALGIGDVETAKVIGADVENRLRILPQIQPKEPIKEPKLPGYFGDLTDSKIKSATVKQVYGVDIPPSAFERKTTPGQDYQISKDIVTYKQKLAGAQSVIQDFESNPALMEGYKKIIDDENVQSAVQIGDVDLAKAYIANLLKDNTKEKVLTNKYINYMKAKKNEQEALTALKELKALGHNVGEIPGLDKSKKNPKVFLNLFPK